MNSCRIFETDRFQKDLKQIAKSGQWKISNKLIEFVYPQLRQSPHYGPNIKKLKSYAPETWRYRIGSWRFFFEIDEEEKIVYLIAAHHRNRAYE